MSPNHHTKPLEELSRFVPIFERVKITHNFQKLTFDLTYVFLNVFLSYEVESWRAA